MSKGRFGIHGGQFVPEALMNAVNEFEEAYFKYKDDPEFVEHHKEDLAASLEHTIVDILMKKLRMAVRQTGVKHVAVAGGVSANNGLRNAFRDHARRYGWTIYIPKFSYTTDNAAMIGVTAYFKFLDRAFCDIDAPAFSKVTFASEEQRR